MCYCHYLLLETWKTQTKAVTSHRSQRRLAAPVLHSLLQKGQTITLYSGVRKMFPSSNNSEVYEIRLGVR